jgi:ribonuclease R
MGADDRPEWDDAAVASQYRLRVTFPSGALAEASGLHEPNPREIKAREDHRDDVVVTVDPSDARDHDDALGARSLGGGRHEVGVHIADVSWYVRPDSALDREARARGTSCYLPGGAVPMLPERLSGDLCSLREGVDRLALSVFATLDDGGRLHGYRFAATVIRSRARLSYERAQRALDGAEPLAEAIQHPLETLMQLARALRARRLAVGALQLESVEVKAVVDEHGETLALERRPHLESHELVEEFMLLANRCVGEAAALRGSGVLWRVHEPPPGRKLADLDETLRVLGLPRLPRHTEDPHRALQALLEVPLDPPKRRLVHRMVLRSLARARYLERDLGHFGLSTREYLHFTSPIRRYPDLHNHRRVREWIERARDQAWDPHETTALAAECSGREQDATDAEREATRVKGLRLLRGDSGSAYRVLSRGSCPGDVSWSWTTHRSMDSLRWATSWTIASNWTPRGCDWWGSERAAGSRSGTRSRSRSPAWTFRRANATWRSSLTTRGGAGRESRARADSQGGKDGTEAIGPAEGPRAARQ